MAAAAAGATPADIAQAKRLVAQLYRRADRIAARSGAPAPPVGMAMGPTFPDPMFRWIVGMFASDVIDYLYGPFKPQMQAPVIQAIKATPRPKVVLAHSLSAQLVHLEAARLLIERGADREQILERVVAARGMARDGLDETRHALSALRGELTPLEDFLAEAGRRGHGARLVRCAPGERVTVGARATA